MPKYSVMFARFPFQNQEAPSSTNWLVETIVYCKGDGRFGDIHHREYDDTPITLSRNRCLKDAKKLGVDFLVLLDSDMFPDVGLTSGYHINGAKKFFPTAIDFALKHSGPCVIAAPYCGPPPHENVYIFRPGTWQSNNPNFDFKIDQFPREDAAQRGGFERVIALPTGLMLIDMRCVPSLRHPYFDYEWTDEAHTEKASTEDVYFSRNLALAGIPQYVAWDCWAGHWKRKLVVKPRLLNIDEVRQEYKDAILRNQKSDEQLIMVGEGKPQATHSGWTGVPVTLPKPVQLKSEFTVTPTEQIKGVYVPTPNPVQQLVTLATHPSDADDEEWADSELDDE